MRISDWSSDVCSSDLFEQTLFDKLPSFDRVYRSMIYWKNESRAIAFTRFGSLLELCGWQSRWIARQVKDPVQRKKLLPDRSEERRVGNECVNTFSSWWSTYH